MISSLATFDKITALGILSRAALSLSDKDNPAAINKFPDELRIRRSVLLDARKMLGISPEDSSVFALEKLGNALDSECDILVGDPNSSDALKRLSEKGQLPSDIFEIDIDSNLENRLGTKYIDEKNIIEKTVHWADTEQHYGPPENKNSPFLVSLFSKYFPSKFRKDSFTMLVVGQRNGILLTVNQAWRIYEGTLKLEKSADLVNLLRLFADKFGIEIEYNGKKGHFFLTEDIKYGRAGNEFKIAHKKKPIHANIICFNQYDPIKKLRRASLVLAIDLNKYRKYIRAHGGYNL